MQNNLTEEQKADIIKRVEAAKVYLKENNLDVATETSSFNLGLIDKKFGNIFATGIVPFLVDTKWVRPQEPETPTVSPLQKDDITPPTA